VKSKLTEKQKRFVEEYLIDLNASGAARRSGYSEANSDKIGSELLGKTRVQQAIRLRMEARARKLEVTAELVIQELAAIGFSNVQEFFELKNDRIVVRKDIFSNLQKARVIRGVSIGTNGVSLLFHDRLKALDLLLRHLQAPQNKADETSESMTDSIARVFENYKMRKEKEAAAKIAKEAENEDNL